MSRQKISEKGKHPERQLRLQCCCRLPAQNSTARNQQQDPESQHIKQGISHKSRFRKKTRSSNITQLVKYEARPSNLILHVYQPSSMSGCAILMPISNVYGSMSYSPSSSSNSPSSSAVASWYCWYSDTKSFMLDSASVNSISSIPSPVY